MPYEITLDERPAGYAMHDATGVEGQSVEVVVREFTSSEDGELFVTRLEGLPATLIHKLPVRVQPSQIDHLLALVRRDLSATVYLNELNILAKIQATRPISAGEPVREDDIADIAEVTFKGVEVPPDVAVMFLFSVGWRKGFFFDLLPIATEPVPMDYDLTKTLGSFYAFLLNRSVFSLTDAQWENLLKSGWFPFISLPRPLLKTLVGRARGSGILDVLVPQVTKAVQESLPRMLKRWETLPEFGPHLALISHAAERFRVPDFISTVAILVPRIEGLLRSVFSSLALREEPTQRTLAGALIDIGADVLHPYSWLLPNRFRQYLTDFYFANFEPGQPAPFSRNSVGHGVADAADFNEKNAAIAFLILDQLYYLVRRVKRNQSGGSSG